MYLAPASASSLHMFGLCMARPMNTWQWGKQRKDMWGWRLAVSSCCSSQSQSHCSRKHTSSGLKLSHWCLISTHARSGEQLGHGACGHHRLLLQLTPLHIGHTLTHIQSLNRTRLLHFCLHPNAMCAHGPDAPSECGCKGQPWHIGRGSETHKHPGQDTKHQHHLSPCS